MTTHTAMPVRHPSRACWWSPPRLAELALRARAVRKHLSDGTPADPNDVIGALDGLLLAASHARWLLKHATEFTLTPPARPSRRVRVVRRGADAWAVWLADFALHPDGCFWSTTPGTEPVYSRDEAITRAIQAVERLP